MDDRTVRRLNLVSKFQERMRTNTGESIKTVVPDTFPELGTPVENDPELDSKIARVKAWFQPLPIGVDPALEQLTKKLEPAFQRAALSGKFNPKDLISATLSKNDQQKILSIIARYCQVESMSEVQWCLNKQKRKEVLQQMIEDANIYDKVRQPLPRTDTMGNMLRKIIEEGDKIKLASMSQDELRSCLLALEVTKGLEFVKPTEDEVRKLIKVSDALDNYNTITSGFVGREMELSKLHAFIDQPSPNYWEGFLITGLGGVGKSTLVAKFLGDVIAQNKATAVIIDFDRPGIDPKDTFWLDLEISRQVGAQYPEFEIGLGKLRKELRDIREFEPDSPDFASESPESLRYSHNIISNIGSLLFSNDHHEKPFLLVLDTIEEATQRLLMSKVVDWIDNIGSVLYPIGLKVIFSGRLFDDSLMQIKHLKHVTETVELKEFDSKVARKFLIQNKVKEDEINQILKSDIVPLRPLELKLVAKLLEDGSLKIDDLLSDLSGEKNNHNTNELFTGIIYRRVLMRLKNPLAREIACPGLILRYLTAELILYVLTPALKLPIKNLDDADRILNELASYNWLCYTERTTTSYKVWHRKDLRRSMLTFMIAKEPEKVKAIRKAAIAYFKMQKANDARAERIYHQLMLISSPNSKEYIEKAKLGEANSYLIADLADLPRPAQVVMKFATDQAISEAEAMLLPARYFEMAYLDTGRKLVRSRQFLQAYEVFKRGKAIGIKEEKNIDSLIDRWDTELLYNLIEWDEIKRLPSYQRSDPHNHYEVALVNYSFPAAVIDPSAKFDKLAALTYNWAKGDIIYQSKTARPDAGLLLYRLSHAFILLNAAGKLPSSIRGDCKKILKSLASEDTPHLVERSRLLLHFLAYEKPPDQYVLSTSLIKLDPEWIAALQEVVPSGSKPLSERLSNLMRQSLSASSVTSKSWLNDVDGAKVKLSSSERKTLLLLHGLPFDQIVKFIKGPDSIFRDPCRYAILDAFKDQKSYMQLAELIQSSIKVTLTDLKPNNFIETISSNPESGLEIFIEIIDRSWAMGEFLKNASELRPQASKLIQVRKAYERWDSAFQKLVTQNINRKK